MTAGKNAIAGAALPGTYAVVQELLAGAPRGAVLDVPCGEGRFTSALRNAGHCVVGGDWRPERARAQGVPVVRLDLNSRLPFRSGSFETAVAIEGIEHLETPYLFVRELHRVLRPGGTLLLTTPNVLNLRSRAKFALCGSLFWFDANGYRKGGHVNALPLYELQHILRETGFAVRQVRVNRRPPGARVLAMAAGPLLRLAAALGGRDATVNSTDLLCGEVLVIAAAKPLPQPGKQGG